MGIESERMIVDVFTLASGLSWASAENCISCQSQARSECLRLEPKFSGLCRALVEWPMMYTVHEAGGRALLSGSV